MGLSLPTNTSTDSSEAHSVAFKLCIYNFVLLKVCSNWKNIYIFSSINCL